jgi:C_GCAxxG_C_C family probable redox protein
MTEQEAIKRAREIFITEENLHGCAETTLIVLQEAYGLPDPTDSSAAMALNGGVAWSGGICGAISGAALAVGRLAACHISDHKEAKRVARSITAELMDGFRREYGAVDCRDLIGLDISTPEGHTAFIEGQVWHTVCMAQIEYTLHKLLYLRDERAWRDRVPPFVEDAREDLLSFPVTAGGNG